MNNLPFSPLVALGSLVFVVVNFFKFVAAKDWNAVITQAIVWGAGVVVIVLFAQTQFANEVSIGSLPLSRAGIGSLIFLGLIASSLLSTFNEAKKAVDTTDTAITPHLLGRRRVLTASSHPHIPPGTTRT